MKNIIYLIIAVVAIVSCTENTQMESAVSVSSGRVERIENFGSDFVKPRNVDVWLPQGYSDKKMYAVLYMHDGQMLFDSTKTWNKQDWGVDDAMTALLKSGKIRETIVVGIWNNERRHSEYFPQKPFEMLDEAYRDSLLTHKELFAVEVQSDNYLKFLVKELKPFVDAKYSTRANREETFVAGSSMGGLISMYAICEYPDVFGGAACLSTHWIGIFNDDNNPIPGKFKEYMAANLPEAKAHKIYFDFGTETLDAYYEPYQKIADSLMLQNGYDHSNWLTMKFEGENHSEEAWKKRLNIPLEFLLKKEIEKKR
ncbi:alpha/beta hydrolase-fold protein [uncultured Draconibacterium sp.]|uniref:alpha/beta hydrolase n=1 Tax=uncultured Draconibacterium sp. TaxID=1573823 RepID=UPI0032607B32